MRGKKKETVPNFYIIMVLLTLQTRSKANGYRKIIIIIMIERRKIEQKKKKKLLIFSEINVI